MRKLLTLITLTVFSMVFGQSSSKINNAQNKWVVNPDPRVLISVDSLNSGTWRVIIKDSIKWDIGNVINLSESLNSKLNSSAISSWALQPNKPAYSYLELSNRANLSISGKTLSISGGNSITLPSTSFTVSNPARAFNTNFTVSNTTLVSYSVKIANGTTLVASTSATAYLEYSLNGGINWASVSQISREENGLSLLTIATKSSTFVLSGIVPANSTVRIRTVVGSGSEVTLISSQETIIN